MELKDTYNQIAEDWASDHQNDDHWLGQGVKSFISFVKPGGKILDIGCGPGWKSRIFAVNGFQVVGIDFSSNFIELAKNRVQKAEFKVEDMYRIEESDEDFDGLFAQAVLLHVPKTKVMDLLTHWLSKLKKGGYLFIGVKEIWQGNSEEETKTENDYGYDYERFFSYFRIEELEKIFNKLNLKVVYKNIYNFKNTNWIQIIGQK